MDTPYVSKEMTKCDQNIPGLVKLPAKVTLVHYRRVVETRSNLNWSDSERHCDLSQLLSASCQSHSCLIAHHDMGQEIRLGIRALSKRSEFWEFFCLYARNLLKGDFLTNKTLRHST